MRLLRSLTLCLLAIALTGCAGYKLGPSNGMESGEKSVQILPFVNRTPEPRLTDAVTEALRKQVQRDGTFKLVTSGAADIVITGVITGYKRAEESLSNKDAASATNYRETMTARVTARDRVSDKIIFEENVTGATLVTVTSDLPSAERQAVPLMAANLARNVTALLADGSW